jgi:FtsH-binding integral membrane protein
MNNEFVSKVFKWFGIGLLVTFLVAYVVSINENLLAFVFSGYIPLVIVVLELVCAIWLSARINNMSREMATSLYLGYTALTGLTFSSIFVAYNMESIIWIFLVTAIIFGIFALIGKNIKINLDGIGIFLVIGLFGVILLEIINMFIMNNVLDMSLCIISIIIFIGYVAYDMQKISRIYNTNDENLAIIAAFNIYLDFINIFIELLRLFGKDRD